MRNITTKIKLNNKNLYSLITWRFKLNRENLKETTLYANKIYWEKNSSKFIDVKTKNKIRNIKEKMDP